MTHRAAVIGLGQIGCGYDADLSPNYVLTHARAFQTHPAFELVGGVDPSPERRRRFESLYQRPAFADCEALETVGPVDVVAISTPTDSHLPLVRLALDRFSLEAVICEKPLAYDVSAAAEILAACEAADSKIVVNYMRRSEPSVCEVKRRFECGEIEAPIRGVAWYSKGLIHNGSHMINLLAHLCGPLVSVQGINPGRPISAVDSEPDAVLHFEKGVVTLLAAEEANFSLHTFDMLAKNGRLTSEQSGADVRWYAAGPDPLLSDYVVLNESGERIPGDSNRTQWHVADQLHAWLSGGVSTRLCLGTEALRTLENCMMVRGAL